MKFPGIGPRKPEKTLGTSFEAQNTCFPPHVVRYRIYISVRRIVAWCATNIILQFLNKSLDEVNEIGELSYCNFKCAQTRGVLVPKCECCVLVFSIERITCITLVGTAGIRITFHAGFGFGFGLLQHASDHRQLLAAKNLQ